MLWHERFEFVPSFPDLFSGGFFQRGSGWDLSSAVCQYFPLVSMLVRASGVVGVGGEDGTKPVRFCSPGAW